MKQVFCVVSLLLLIVMVNAQAGAYVDPAQAFNRIQLEKKDGNSLERVGTYKVQGSPYLYGGNQVSSVYGKGLSLKDLLKVSYNTYSQKIELEFNSDVKSEAKTNAEIDSFVLKVSITDYKADLKFCSAKIFESKENFFLQEVYKGAKYSLYKRYKSELGYVSTNIVQSELRQYDLVYDYFYVTEGAKGLKSIKASAKGVLKEFAKIKDVSKIVDEGSFVFKPEEVLINVFSSINE